MTENKIYQGIVKIGDVEIPCAVKDGVRIISQSTLNAILKRPEGGGSRNLPRVIDLKALEPFINNDLRSRVSNLIQIGRIKGFDALILTDICEVWLRAREAGVLNERHLRTAMMAEILMRGLSNIGIAALIDEATGYQKDRKDDDLQRLLGIYLRDEKLKWAKTFPDSYYKELFRLRNWQYNPINTKRSSLVGKLTNKLVYDKLPEGVLPKLKELNPIDPKTRRRKSKHFQYLSQEIGQPDLRDHLLQLIAIMRSSPNWGSFLRSFARAFPEGEQQEFDYEIK